MSNDRELLDLAAKAAGIRIKFEDIYPLRFVGHNPDAGNQENWADWNPLTDDGDALRLAVKLQLTVKYNSALEQGFAWDVAQTEVSVNFEDTARDRYAATRRAIVRAAAAIGKGGSNG